MGICPVRGDGVAGPPFSLRQCYNPLILSHLVCTVVPESVHLDSIYIYSPVMPVLGVVHRQHQ